jgi:hypothetical protein
MSADRFTQSLNDHYGRRDLGTDILAALRATGKDPDALTPDDLAPVDPFHLRGKEATLELARLAGIAAGARASWTWAGVWAAPLAPSPARWTGST